MERENGKNAASVECIKNRKILVGLEPIEKIKTSKKCGRDEK